MEQQVCLTTRAVSANEQPGDGMARVEDQQSEKQFLPGITKTGTLVSFCGLLFVSLTTFSLWFSWLSNVFRKSKTKTSKQAKYGKMRLGVESSEKQLLPNIPNHITEDLILGKLSWGTLQILSTVSRSWNQAFQSRLDARLRSLATETTERNVFYLYDNWLCSPVDSFYFRLPPIPNVATGSSGTGYTECSGCVLVNGRVYCMGGDQYDGNKCYVGRRDEVYVMDVGGERKWQQCKSMPSARSWRSDCICKLVGLNGKIYVNTHKYSLGNLRFSEVYDPKTDTWDWIRVDPGRSGLDVIPGLREVLINVLAMKSTIPHKLLFRGTSTGSSFLATNPCWKNNCVTRLQIAWLRWFDRTLDQIVLYYDCQVLNGDLWI